MRTLWPLCFLERPVRIELTALAWKAKVLPLYDGRLIYGFGTILMIGLTTLGGSKTVLTIRSQLNFRKASAIAELHAPTLS